jgi:site-specific DNA recombinase
MLNAKHKGLVEEREAVTQRKKAWEMAQDRLDQLEAWCRTVAANIEDMSYQQKRLALDALGVTARVYRAGHEPRYEIEANIPMSEDQVVFNTR